MFICIKLKRILENGHKHVHALLLPRPASEYSSPSGRPLSCVVDENTPVMTPVNGAEASGPPGEQRIQERRVRSQRHRNYMSRTHLHTPPDLPEGYGERRQHRRHTHHTLPFSTHCLKKTVTDLPCLVMFTWWKKWSYVLCLLADGPELLSNMC